MLTLIPFPDANGFSSGTVLTTLWIAFLADCRADDRWLSIKAGRGPSDPTVEFLGLDRISPVAHDHLLLSGGLVLLSEDRGDA